MAKAGNTEGAFVMMVSARPSDPPRLNEAITPELLDGWCKRPGIARIVFAQPDETASTHVTEESRRSGNRFAEEWIFWWKGSLKRIFGILLAMNSLLHAAIFGA